MEKIINKKEVEEHSVEEYDVEDVSLEIQNTEFKDRAFSELINNNIINNKEYRGFGVQYTVSPHNDSVADSRFAVFENGVGYLSWIWVADVLRGMGIGTKLVGQTVDVMDSKGVKEVYTLAKSPEAQHIFCENYKFESCDSIPGNWFRRNLGGS